MCTFSSHLQEKVSTEDHGENAKERSNIVNIAYTIIKGKEIYTLVNLLYDHKESEKLTELVAKNS